MRSNFQVEYDGAVFFMNLCMDFECQNIIDEIAEGLERFVSGAKQRIAK